MSRHTGKKDLGGAIAATRFICFQTPAENRRVSPRYSSGGRREVVPRRCGLCDISYRDGAVSYCDMPVPDFVMSNFRARNESNIMGLELLSIVLGISILLALSLCTRTRCVSFVDRYQHLRGGDRR